MKILTIFLFQRCIVIHASHNLTIDSNVAYNTAGHCFLLEEGGESNNTFINNIGAMTNTGSFPSFPDFCCSFGPFFVFSSLF